MSTIRKASSQLIREPKRNIRIRLGNNPLKLAVARVISEWISAPDRYWNFKASLDENSKRLVTYLQKMFPEFTWYSISSQMSFDIVSFDAKVVIEVKAAKKGQRKVISNAAIYPDYVYAKDVGGAKLLKKAAADPETRLECLILVVDRYKNLVHNYSIIDGSYYGVEYKDYIGCKRLFKLINEGPFLGAILDTCNDEYEEHFNEENSFVTKVLNGNYGKDFYFGLRKLIKLPNPNFFGLDVSSKWNNVD